MGFDKTILLIDDDQDIHRIGKKYIEGTGCHFLSAFSGHEGLEKILNSKIDLILLDYSLPDMNGIEVFKTFKFTEKYEKFSPIPVIILAAISEDFAAQKEMLELGADFYLRKPFGYHELINIMENIFIQNEIKLKQEQPDQKNQLYIQRLLVENQRLTSQIQDYFDFKNIISNNSVMLDIFDKILKIAKTDANIFIYGENGTGKELIARSIHLKSRRNQYAFIPVDCMSLPAHLLEHELFGQMDECGKGNKSARLGFLQLANNGTLFMDEITQLSADSQGKFLQAIQEKRFRPLGSSKMVDMDVRIISTSTIPPENAVNEKHFREELYYHLNVIPLKIPSLRERKEDIPLLVNYFIKKISGAQKKNMVKFSPEAMQLLQNYRWPGNVRELQNVIERVISLARNNHIHPEDLPDHIVNQSEFPQYVPGPQLSLKDARKKWMEKFERNYLIELLSRCNGNISEVARIAHSNRMTVYRMIKNYNISTKKFIRK
jgi:DNA-binding NtrC family response regulator